MATIECPRCGKSVTVTQIFADEQARLPVEQHEIILCDDCENELDNA